ncbi:uncharacterized protein LOC111123606 isoform X1 [Crassostrea virginica]
MTNMSINIEILAAIQGHQHISLYKPSTSFSGSVLRLLQHRDNGHFSLLPFHSFCCCVIHQLSRSVETTFNCIENAYKPCGGLSGDILAKAKEKVAKYGCSAPGLPAVSALCLLMAALFHILL